MTGYGYDRVRCLPCWCRPVVQVRQVHIEGGTVTLNMNEPQEVLRKKLSLFEHVPTELVHRAGDAMPGFFHERVTITWPTCDVTIPASAPIITHRPCPRHWRTGRDDDNR